MSNGLSCRLRVIGILLLASAGIAASEPEKTISLPETPAWQIGGGQAGAALGAAVASAGDVNGDGFADVLVGAPGYNSPASPGAHEGRALVYLGSSQGPATRPVWSFEGAQSGFGAAVATAGDVNGDGYADIIVGEPDLRSNEPIPHLIGGAFVYAGSASGPSATPVWTAHTTFEIPFGAAVASAGDVNSDGYDDVLVGAPSTGGTSSRVFLYAGSSGGVSSTPAWSVQRLSNSPTGPFGSTIAGAGDVNGDGYDDVLVGEPGYAPNCNLGRVELYYGSSSGLSTASAWTLIGQANCNPVQARAGSSLSSGNFDGDQYSDILIGGSGQTSTFFRGSPTGPVSTSWLCGGPGQPCGDLLQNAGDVNGDGYDDVLVAGSIGSTAAIYPGGASGPAAAPIWSAAIPRAPNDRIAIAGAGDTDGDQLANVLVGNRDYEFSQTNDGVVSLYFGPEVATHPPVAGIAASAPFECDRPGAGAVALDGADSSDPDSTPGTNDDIASFEWFENGASGQQPIGSGEALNVDLALGAHTIALKVTDFTGRIDEVSTTVSVVDTMPPSLTLNYDPGTLWPPNHRLVPAFFSWSATDLCQSSPIGVDLVSTASSEPDDAAGDFDGATTSDIQGAEPGTSDRDVILRAERDRRGTGRTYTVIYRARDASGNATTTPAMVSVPIVSETPPEPLILHVEHDTPGSSNVRITWAPVPDATGYDVLTGDLQGWHLVDGVLDVGFVLVLERSTTATSVVEPSGTAIPPAGSVTFYLVQQRLLDVGVGYGTETAPWPRDATWCDFGCP